MLNKQNTEISCCVKYTVFSFNVIFWIIGFLFLAIGIWAHLEKYNPQSQVSQISKFHLNPACLLIIAGTATFILGFSGNQSLNKWKIFFFRMCWRTSRKYMVFIYLFINAWFIIFCRSNYCGCCLCFKRLDRNRIKNKIWWHGLLNKIF